VRYVAFDLEIAKAIPDGETDWDKHRPLGISCAATLTSDGDLKLWHGKESGGVYAEKMTPAEVGRLAEYLQELARGGYPALSWNGLGFDFKVLADEAAAGYTNQIHQMAMDHIDPGFQMVCQKGYMVGLDTAAQGLGVEGKTEGMRGDLAPVMWAQGREAQEKVLRYVAQDVRATANVAEGLIKQRWLRWITKRGYVTKSPWRPTFKAGRLLTVKECLDLPGPDLEWAWSRASFMEWMMD